MNYKSQLPVEAIVARLDNDFNIDNSDYIPRVAAWCIDLMNQMKITKYEVKRVKSPVEDRKATLPCCDTDRIRVFDEEGCEVNRISKNSCGCGIKHSSVEYFTQDAERAAEERNNKKYPSRRVVEYDVYNPSGRNYVLLRDSNMIDLNFDADYVTIEFLTVVTYYSEAYNCNLPYIPNNGKLIECLEWFCIWKMLSRGMKHPVYNLQGQLPVNPYLLYRDIYPKALASVIIDNQDANGGIDKGWTQFFYNSTFYETCTTTKS